MKPLVIYHANCTDGLTAAWVALRALGDADTHAANYGAEPPDCTGRDVVLIDFTYKRAVLQKMREIANSILVLDHHKTAQEDLAEGSGFIDISGWSQPLSWARHMDNVMQDDCEGARNTVYIVFDMNRSGAMIAWDFFHPGGLIKERPLLIDYVQDRDLWRWQLPDSRLVSAAIEALPRTFETWDALAVGEISKLVTAGRVIENYRQRCIESAVALARPAVIAGHVVKCANISEMRFGSDSAHELSKGAPFGAYWFLRADGVVQFGLRSTEEGLDVSEIAKRYGGGGHKHAAGFQVSLADLASIVAS